MITEIVNHSKFDECEIVSIHKKIITVRIADSKIIELKQNLEKSFGIRAINDKRITSCQLDDENNIERIIDKLDHSTTKSHFWKSLPNSLDKITLDGTFDHKLDDIDCKGSADIAQEMINSTLDNKISTISGSLNIISEKFEIVNSNGLFGADNATYISGIINTQSDNSSGFGQQCCRTLDKFSPKLIGHDSKRMCLESINPKICSDGNYTIILEPYCMGKLLAFVVSPNFNLRLNEKSCFADKFGEEISRDNFSLVDDPHISEGVGTKPFDDEGVNTRKNHLINNGTFENVYSNLYDSFKEDKESTGNATREDSMGRGADPIPYTKPHNLHVMSGDQSIEEMIKDTKHGILIGRLWYTYALNPIKGDFSCTARSGIKLIDHGEIYPIKPVRIIHNLPTMLYDISSIGKQTQNVLPWASIPSITPAIKFDNVPILSI